MKMPVLVQAIIVNTQIKRIRSVGIVIDDRNKAINNTK